MKIMVVGGGGREHAIIRTLKKSKNVQEIYALPGNGGIAQDATCVPIGAMDLDAIVNFAVEKQIDFAVVAPDDPLAAGCVDRLHEAGVACFGPEAKAAEIEASKVFSKNLMKKYGIPTAEYEVFTDAAAAKAYIRRRERYPVVVKADGLALGKGVLICEDESSAMDAVDAIMLDKRFGASGNRIVVEEFLTGPEVSVLAFTDGKSVKPMVSSMDHKRVGDNDTGLNTGGMGTIAPNPYYTAETAEICTREIFLPTLQAMNAEGRCFKGCLYFGLMLTANGPKVIEYNCRFGDPETQVVLPLLKGDLLEIMLACEHGTLADVDVEFADGAACCVMIASGGYPEKYEKGKKIDLGGAEDAENISVFHSGTAEKDGALVTASGRVLGVCATAATPADAISDAYAAARKVRFDGMYMRSDIGARAMKALERA